MFRLFIGGAHVFFLPVGQLPPPPGLYAQEHGRDKAAIKGRVENIVEWPYNFGEHVMHPHQTTDWRARSRHIADRRRFT